MQEQDLGRADVGEWTENTMSGSEKSKETGTENFAIPKISGATLRDVLYSLVGMWSVENEVVKTKNA